MYKILKFLKWLLPHGLVLALRQRRERQKEQEAKAASDKVKLPPVKTHTLSLTRSPGLNAFSQGGEDLLLRAFSDLDQKAKGFYVDIGAFHPVAGSNTKHFYDLGWQGINIDPNPDTYALFQEKRPRDINLNIGVSDHNGTLDYYYFGPNKSINTFDAELAQKFARSFRLPSAEKRAVPVRAISEVLAEHVPKNTPIDFLSLDVEGMEKPILHNWDFENFAPRYLLVEDLTLESQNLRQVDWNRLQTSEQHQFLTSRGYVFKGKTVLTLLYALEKTSRLKL